MRITNVYLNQNQPINHTGNLLENFNIGDILRARIIDFTSKELLLRLFDGTEIKASSLIDLDVKKGDVLSFIVKDKSNQQLFLETLKNQDDIAMKQDDILKAQLADLGIDSENADAMRVAKEMNANDMILNGDIIKDILNLLDSLNDANVEKAVFLFNNKINPENFNMEALNRLIEGKLDLTTKLESLRQLLNAEAEKSTDDIPENKDALKNNLLKNISLLEDDAQNTDVNVAENNNILRGNDLLKDIGTLKDNMRNTDFHISDSSNIPENDDFLKNNGILEDDIQNTDLHIEKNNNSLRNKELLKRNGNIKDDIHNAKDHITDNNITKNITRKNNTLKDDEFVSKSIDSLFADIYSDKLEEKINVNKLYNNLFEKLNQLKEHIENSESIQNKQSLLAAIDNILGDIDFFNQLNVYTGYVQIPLRINNEDTTGQLYIMKRKSSKKNVAKQGITLLISLNTHNLGMIDSLISLNNNNLVVNMRVENQEIIDIIKQYHTSLYNSLSNKGFKLVDLKYKLISEPVNILNANKQIVEEEKRSSKCIDVKI